MTDQITIPRALLEQALEALELRYAPDDILKIDAAKTAIRSELAKPVQQAEQSWNRSIRDSVDVLLAGAGYQPDSSARHQLSMMNFDQKAQATPAWHDAPTPTPATAPSELTGQGAALYKQLIAAVKRLLSAQDEPERFGCVGPSPSEIAHRNLMQLIQHVCTGIDSPPAPASAPEQPAWHDAPEVAALKAERDAAMKDAERYRYLRGQQHWSEALEKAIDSAIAKAEGRKE